MAKVKGSLQINLSEEFAELLKNYAQRFSKQKELALEAAAEELRKDLSFASPKGETLQYMKNWIVIDKYKGVKYIGNTTTNDKGIPLSNLLEFSSKGNPHIQTTFERNKEKYFRIIKGVLENEWKC